MTRISPNIPIFIKNTNNLILLLKDRLSDGKYVELSYMLFIKYVTWHKIESLEIKLISPIKKSKKCSINI